MRYFKNILKAIGNTPLVKLNRITEGIKATILAKLEAFNPGGSVKDRIGIAMIEDAEKRGIIKPGYTIVEPTSGNTGVGLALAAAVKGYKMIFTIPDKMSKEKIDLLKAFGAKVIITPTAVPPDHPANYVKVAERIVRETPNSFMPNQYFNVANPEIHYRTTGPEIWEQTDGKIDMLVASMGTGGTISGSGRYLKEKKPSVRVIGVDPEGSLYHHAFYGTEGDIHSYKVEGIGEDFLPSTIDLKIVDEIITVSDKDAFLTARELAQKEGIFAGGSSGAAVFAAIKVAKDLDDGQTVVVILPDTGRNYLSKIYSDEWMYEHGFIEPIGERISVEEILKAKERRIAGIISVQPEDKIKVAISLMIKYNISQLPVIKDGVAIGSVSEKNLMEQIYKMRSQQGGQDTGIYEQPIRDVMQPPLPQVQKTDSILNPFTLLKDSNAITVLDGKQIADIITTIDVINFLMRG